MMDSSNEKNVRSSYEIDPRDVNISSASAQISSVMDDEGPDDVFIPPPPPPPSTCEAHLLPTEGSRDVTASNSGMTLSNGAADASSTKANPNSLDRHHGDKQLMTVQNEMDEVIPGTIPSPRESVDNISPSNDENFNPTVCHDQTSVEGAAFSMESCQDKAVKDPQDDKSGEEGSNDEQEDVAILAKEEENCGENHVNRKCFLQQILSKSDKNNETCLGKEDDETKYEDICCVDQRDFKPSRYNLDSESVKTNVPTLPGLIESSELCRFSQNRKDAIIQPQISGEITRSNEEQVGSRSLDYNLTTFDCLKSECGTAEAQISHLCKGSEETVEQIASSWKIATNIQQGEQLLQRLQMVQLRHDEVPNAPQETKDTKVEERIKFWSKTEDGQLRETSSSEEGEEWSELIPVKEEEARTYLAEIDKREGPVQTETNFLSTTPEQNLIDENEEGESLDNQKESLQYSDSALRETSCTAIPFISKAHRFSAAETSKEKLIHEAAQGKQSLQRAEGLFNLAENPDVLEIPFKTDVSLESLLTQACNSQPSPWQFSEKKMQREINQEIQREQVLVNQGKIPGGYSKGEVRQLKETKMLFEALKQDNKKNPKRKQKTPSSVMKGDAYPSVLERTRSLEMFSLKTCPVARAQSLRLNNSETTHRDKSSENVRSRSPENFRSKSPTGVSREKTRLSPYLKQDKQLRLHRSMDSISSQASTSAAKIRDKTKEGEMMHESPILKQNPFFKLRPALALQPEVEKDIREAKEREEELRRQRCKLYGEHRQNSEDEEKSRCSQTFRSDAALQSRGKLERVWPPPCKNDQNKSDYNQTQQEVKVQRAGGQRALLWQRWESGQIKEPPPDEKK